MKSIAVRLTSLLLAVLMLSGTLLACGTAQPEAPDTQPAVTTAAPESTETAAAPEIAEPPEPIVPENLPDLTFDGAAYRVYTRSCCPNHRDGIYMPEVRGDVILDAVHDRNLAVEERFNIRITEPILGADGDATALFQAAQAGDDLCELALWHFKHLGDAAIRGYLADLAAGEFFDFTQPWWYQKVNDAYSIGGHSYLAVGMYDLDNYYDTCCIYFNKGILTDIRGDADLYAEVKDGKWTIDRMTELCDEAKADLNADGRMDLAADRFGYGMQSDYAVVYQFAWDQPVTVRDDAGYPVDAINTERMLTMTEKFQSFLFDHDAVFVDDGMPVQAFMEGRELFLLLSLGFSTGTFRELEQDFGILPMPKLDEAQKEYYTHATAHATAAAIPSVKNKEGMAYSSLILEALAAGGYRVIRPAVYDVALKYKYTRDVESYEMIDILVEGRAADFAEIYDNWGLTYTLINIARKQFKGWASYYRGKQKIQEKTIENIVSVFRNLEAAEGGGN